MNNTYPILEDEYSSCIFSMFTSMDVSEGHDLSTIKDVGAKFLPFDNDPSMSEEVAIIEKVELDYLIDHGLVTRVTLRILDNAPATIVKKCISEKTPLVLSPSIDPETKQLLKFDIDVVSC